MFVLQKKLHSLKNFALVIFPYDIAMDMVLEEETQEVVRIL